MEEWFQCLFVHLVRNSADFVIFAIGFTGVQVIYHGIILQFLSSNNLNR